MSFKTIALTAVISILGFVGVVAAAANLGIIPTRDDTQDPLINGTIINYNNKTFSILIRPSDSNLTVPVTPPPVINNTVDNDTVPNPIPIPIPPIINDTQPPVINETQPPVVNETPPVPEPSGTDKKVIVVGDVDDSTGGKAVFNTIKSKNADAVVVAGDLGYDSTLSWFKSTYGTLKMVCVPGNHEDDAEDGSAALEKETLAYCSNPFYFKLNGVLFLGINTNGNIDVELGQAQQLVMNPKFMAGVKEVHLLTHKPCATPPNSHHPANEDEAAKDVVTLCNSLKAKIPTGVKFVSDSAHNHVLSTSVDGMYKTSGAGGRNHYECGTSTAFPWCDNTHYGYLEYIIKPDGTSSYHFYDSTGKVLR